MDRSCLECGACDWASNNSRGDIYCFACGAVADSVRLAVAKYKDLFDEARNFKMGQGPSTLYTGGGDGGVVFESSVRRNESAPYKRQTYFAERLSQWQMLEPEIKEDDWIKIELAYSQRKHELRRDDGRLAIPTKEFIRSLLRGIDDELQKPRFVLKYLEKFLTIRYRLCGVKSFGAEAPGWLIEEMKSMFRQLEIPFDRIVRRRGSRYSFPNYNFVIRRLFDLLGCPNFGLDFPPLKSNKKRIEIVAIWISLVRFLNWPYINSDGNLFGSKYHTPISRRILEFTRPRSEQQQHRSQTKPNPDTNNRDQGLRRQSANSESAALGDVLSEQAAANLLATLADLDHCFGDLTVNDHLHQRRESDMDCTT